MPLQDQVIALSLDVGIETGADPKTIVGLTKAENAVAVRRGELRKRYGQARSAAAVSGLTQIFPYRQSLFALGEGIAPRVYDPATDTWTALPDARHWIEHGHVGTLTSITSNPEGQWDVMRNGNVIVFAGQRNTASANAVLITYDARTWRQISRVLPDLGDDSWFRLVLIGGLVRIYYYVSGACKRREIAADGSIGSAVTVTTVTNPSTSMWPMDACVVGTTVQLAWYDATAGKFKLASLPSGNDAGSTTTDIATTAAPLDIAVAALDSDSVLVVHALDDAGTSKTYATALNINGNVEITTGLIHSTTSTVDMVSCIGRNHTGLSSHGTAYVRYHDEANSAVSTYPHTTAEVDLNGGGGSYVANSTTNYFRTGLLTKPCPVGSTGWLVAMTCITDRHFGGAADQRSIVVFSGGIAGGLTISGRMHEGVSLWAIRPNLWAPYGSTYGYFAAAHLYSQRMAPTNPYAYRDANAYRVTATEVRPHRVSAIESDGVLLLSGSCPRYYDGEEIAEQGWLHYPEEASVDRSAGATGLTSGGQYYYKLTYEHFDAAGRRTQSVPTPVAIAPTNAPSTDNLHVTLKVPNPPATERSGRMFVVAWRTVAGGTIFYRALAAALDPTAAITTLEDSLADVTLQTGARLFTTGGELEAEPPPPYAIQTLHQGRHIIARMDSPDRSVRYSRVKYDQEPYLHNRVLEIAHDEDGGALTALISMGDKLVSAKRQRAYAIEGEGLADNGTGAGYVEPYSVSPTIGCTDWRTLARIPQGVMLLGEDGIWLLSIAGSMQPIGDPVRYYTDTYSIVQAIVLAERTQVVFLTSDGPAIVYDWLRDRWTVWTGMQSISGCALSDVLHRLDSSGYIWKQDSGRDDNGSHVALQIETSHLAPWGIGQNGRVREIGLIGQYIGTCQLTVQVAYDNEPAWYPALTLDIGLQPFDVSDYYGAGLTLATYADQAMILRVHPPRRRCKAFRVRILEVNDSLPDTAGFALSAIVVRYAAKSGLAKTGSGRRIGA